MSRTAAFRSWKEVRVVFRLCSPCQAVLPELSTLLAPPYLSFPLGQVTQVRQIHKTFNNSHEDSYMETSTQHNTFTLLKHIPSTYIQL